MAHTPTSSTTSSFPPSSSSTITHIVLFKYRPAITWTDLESHFTEFTALQRKCLHPSTGKPYMLSMRMGKNRSWEPYSKGMTHGFVLEFASQDDLDYYLTTDPVHAAFSKAAKPMIEDSLVLDILPGQLFGPSPPAPTTKTTHTGTCHCGNLTFTAALPTHPTPSHVLCHCRTCQLLSGAPYTCNQIIPRGDLTITKGSPAEYAYTGASGKKVHCFFCRDCTSHVYHLQDVNPDVIVVRTLLLEPGAGWDAGAEIFAEGRLGWVKELGDALKE